MLRLGLAFWAMCVGLVGIWWVGNGPGVGIGRGFGNLWDLELVLFSSWIGKVYCFFFFVSCGCLVVGSGVGSVIMGVGSSVRVGNSCNCVLIGLGSSAGQCFGLFLGVWVGNWVGNGVGNGVGSAPWAGFGFGNSFCCFGFGSCVK